MQNVGFSLPTRGLLLAGAAALAFQPAGGSALHGEWAPRGGLSPLECVAQAAQGRQVHLHGG